MYRFLLQRLSLSQARSLFVLIFLSVIMVSVQAGTYRWVDSKGVVHFSDQVPPEEAKHERKILDKSGRTLDTIERTKTVEELKEQRRLEKIKAEEDRKAQQVKERDRMLLLTYQSVSEINAARDEKIATIRNAVEIASSTLKQQKSRLSELRQSAADYERSSRPIPKKLINEITDAKSRIIRTNNYIERREREQQLITAEFDRFVKRYKFLTE